MLYLLDRSGWARFAQHLNGWVVATFVLAIVSVGGIFAVARHYARRDTAIASPPRRNRDVCVRAANH